MVHTTGVIHGRFQPLHNDHMKYILAGWNRCDHLFVGITNPDPSLTRSDAADTDRSTLLANPLTYFERYEIIKVALSESGLNHDQFSVVPLPINMPELYRYYVPLDAVFYLTIYDDWGRRKLDLFTSQGLKTDVMWERPPERKGLTSSMIREAMVNGKPWEHMVPPSVGLLLNKWNIPDRLRRLPKGLSE